MTSFTDISRTYIENWPTALHCLSIPQVAIPLSLEDARMIGSRIHRYGHWFPGHSDTGLDHVIQNLETAIRMFPGGAFIRLGSRSAKDSYYALNRGLRVTDSHSAMKMLTGASRRIALDLVQALRHHYQPHIYVRKWLDIPRWTEFRCFMRHRKLVGISQYDCDDVTHSSEIAKNENRITAAIDVFFEEFRSASHLDDVVFDLFLDIDPDNVETSIDVTLLELNPFISKMDPCLFDWSVEGDFDGSFRYPSTTSP